MRTTIRIAGADIEVVPDEEAEKCDWVVCMPWKGVHYFDDDVMGRCAVCGIEVRYRPHAPKKPPRICVECAIQHAKRQ
jgi:hypothetical protein